MDIGNNFSDTAEKDEDQMELLSKKIESEDVQLAKDITQIVQDANLRIDSYADKMIALKQRKTGKDD